MALRVINQKDIDGFSIVELVVVIAIAAILLGITTMAFNSWTVKHNVEAQVRQMITDMNEVRVLALTTKQRHSITLNAGSYVFRSYTSDSENLLSGGRTITGGSHTVPYRLKKSSSAYFAGAAADVVEVDQRGTAIFDQNALSPFYIYLDYPGSSTPALNCITLQTIRINPGNAEWRHL